MSRTHSSCITKTFYPLTTISHFPLLASKPGNYYSTLLLGIWLFYIPHISEIMQCLSFYIWLMLNLHTHTCDISHRNKRTVLTLWTDRYCDIKMKNKLILRGRQHPKANIIQGVLRNFTENTTLLGFIEESICSCVLYSVLLYWNNCSSVIK